MCVKLYYDGCDVDAMLSKICYFYICEADISFANVINTALWGA